MINYIVESYLYEIVVNWSTIMLFFAELKNVD